MGTQFISVKPQRDSRRRRSSFRRLFVWYCVGVLAATFVLTGLVQAFLSYLESLGDFPLQIMFSLLAIAAPLVVPSAAIFFFAWLMGQKISQPVSELMRAVEKIRQQDLDFSITYSAGNELGDLCSALNELRREL